MAGPWTLRLESATASSPSDVALAARRLPPGIAGVKAGMYEFGRGCGVRMGQREIASHSACVGPRGLARLFGTPACAAPSPRRVSPIGGPEVIGRVHSGWGPAFETLGRIHLARSTWRTLQLISRQRRNASAGVVNGESARHDSMILYVSLTLMVELDGTEAGELASSHRLLDNQDVSACPDTPNLRPGTHADGRFEAATIIGPFPNLACRALRPGIDAARYRMRRRRCVTDASQAAAAAEFCKDTHRAGGARRAAG